MNAPGTWRPWDWYGIVRKLMHGESHYRPWEIARLTEPEIAAALDDDLTKRRPPEGATLFNSDAERIAYMKQRIAESPRELLARLREE